MGLSPPLSIFPLLLSSGSLCGEESLWVASPQTSFGVRLSRIHDKRTPKDVCGEASLWDDWSNKLTFTFGKLQWLVLGQTTSQNPKRIPESKSTSQNREPAPARIQNTSQNLRTHPRIQKHFPHSVPESTDSGTCFWIQRCVLDSGKCFVLTSRHRKLHPPW